MSNTGRLLTRRASSIVRAGQVHLNGVPLVENQENAVKRAVQTLKSGRVDHVANSEKEYTEEEAAFLAAIRAYQLKNDRKFPAFTEVFAIVRGMGYIKVPHGFRLVPTEPADAPPETTPAQPHIRLYREDE